MSCGAASPYSLKRRSQCFGVLGVKGGEGRQQLAQVHHSGVVHVPSVVHVEAALQDVAEFPGHHLGVDGVRDARRQTAIDQPQVADVLQVAQVVFRVATGEDRLDDAAHALLLQLVRELVEVRAPGKDQLLPGGVDVLHADGPGAVAPGLVVEAGAGAQRVHQPRLAAGVLPHGPARRRREALAGLEGVLRHQPARLPPREVAEAQGLRGDVEGAAAGDHLAGAGLDAVVPYVPHAAEHDAVREAPRAVLVAGAQLAQHGEQGVAHQGVDLVHQQHQRRRVRQAPSGERPPQGVVRARLGQNVRPHFLRIVVAEQLGAQGQAAEDRAHAFLHVVAGHLADFHVHVDATEAAGTLARGRAIGAVQEVAQGDEGGGLAGLPAARAARSTACRGSAAGFQRRCRA